MDWKSLAHSLPWTRGVSVIKCDAAGLIAVEKPPGTLSHPNRSGERGQALLEAPYDATLQAYSVPRDGAAEALSVFLLNRLDSATSGIVLLALQEEVATAVRLAFEQKRVQKTYAAYVFGHPGRGNPVWRDRLSTRKAEGGVRAESGSGAMAETRLIRAEPVQGLPGVSLLTLSPITGRTHQLRIQSAKRAIPIVGDRTYGDFGKNKRIAKEKGLKRLCLHCVETSLSYEVGGRRVSFSARSERGF